MVTPEQIRKLRQQIGWSARELARRARVSVQWISDVEAGINQNPGWQRLVAVEQAFREALAELGTAIGVSQEQTAEPREDLGPEPGFLLLSESAVLRRQLGISDELMRTLLSFRMGGIVQTIEDAVPHALAAKATLERPRRADE